MATITVTIPDGKWGTISRIAAREGLDVASWVEDFVAQQTRIVLETARQELEMGEMEFLAHLEQLDTSGKAHQQAVMDAFIDEIMATFDFDGLLAMHDRVFEPINSRRSSSGS
jgi:hypothetical protein